MKIGLFRGRSCAMSKIRLTLALLQTCKQTPVANRDNNRDNGFQCTPRIMSENTTHLPGPEERVHEGVHAG